MLRDTRLFGGNRFISRRVITCKSLFSWGGILKLSVIVPVLNEKDTIQAVLNKVLAVPVKKEVIVVDDGSIDGTWQALQGFADRCKLLRHPRNLGKGAAIRTALPHVTGDIVITQDADLEYEPEDYPRLVQPILEGRTDVVYGSRLLHGKSPRSSLAFYLGGRFLTWLTNLLYGLNITDEPTGYKVFRTEVLRRLPLKSDGFEFCPEVTALLALNGVFIAEVPISYTPRSIEEGKKIRWRDGWIAIWTLVRYRFGWCAPSRIIG